MGLFSNKSAKKNRQAALDLAQKAQWNPYSSNVNGNMVSFDGSNVSAQMNPMQQGITRGLMGMGSGFLSGIAPATASTSLNPFLSGEFDTTNGMMGGVDPSQFDTSQYGGMAGEAARGFFGSLGSFDPNQAAADYTGILRQQAVPEQQRTVNSALSSLFSTGRLGTTGGAQQVEALANAQNQQDLGFQLAGRQYAGQEQSRMAGLASGFAGQAADIGGQNFMQALQGQQFNNQRAMARFQNAMSLFGGSMDANQYGTQTQLANNSLFGQLGGSLLGAGVNADQGYQQLLMSQMGMGGDLGSARTQGQLAAWSPYFNARVAENNAKGGFLSKIGGIVGQGIGGWLGGPMGAQIGGAILGG